MPQEVPPPSAVHDLVGVGFGPSNLGLAIALDEQGSGLTTRFVERQEGFGWHRGMLLEDATMQVSFLKDLVTLRNPASGTASCPTCRIAAGSSTSSTTAARSRLAWSSTTTWNGRRPRSPTGSTTAPTVAAHRGGGRATPDLRRRARPRRAPCCAPATSCSPPGSAAPADGGAQRRPRVAQQRAAHPDRLARRPAAVVVVGAGQSAAEAVGSPAPHVPRRRGLRGLQPLRLQPGRRQLLRQPCLRPRCRRRILRRARRGQATSSWATTATPTTPWWTPSSSRRCTGAHYHEKVSGRERLRFLNVSRVADAIRIEGEVDGRVEVAVESMLDGEPRGARPPTSVVYATGYRPSDPCALLGEVAETLPAR